MTYKEFENELRVFMEAAFNSGYYQGCMAMGIRSRADDFVFTDKMHEDYIKLAAQAIENRNTWKENLLNAFDKMIDELGEANAD